MFMLLLLAIAGVLWLGHRVKLLLQLPIDASVKNLMISIPTVPLISINRVTDTTIMLHWDSTLNDQLNDKQSKNDKRDVKDLTDPLVLPQLQPNSISHYILYINGLQAAEINGREVCCELEHLNPATGYQIDLVAFNMAGYRSKSSSVYVRTAAKSLTHAIKDEGMEYPDSIIRSLLSKEERSALVKVRVFKGSTPVNRSRSGTLIDSPGSTPDGKYDQDLSKALTSLTTNERHTHDNPHLTNDVNHLKWMLESLLAEFNSVLKAQKEAETEYKEEEASLIISRNEAKERRKYEDASRASLRQEIKLLEEQRMKGKTRFSKDEKKIEKKNLKIGKQLEEIQKWKDEIKEMKLKEIQFEKERPERIDQYHNEVEILKNEINTIQSEINSIDENLKASISKRKKMDTVKTELEQNASKLAACMDSNGLYNIEGVGIIESIAAMFPEWAKELRNELIIKDQDTFNSWKKAKDELLRKVNQNLKKSKEDYHQYGSQDNKKQTVNSMSHLMRPSLSNSNSFQGSNISPSNFDGSHSRIPSGSNSLILNTENNGMWSQPGSSNLNLTLTPNPTQLINRDPNASSEMNMLYSQRIISDDMNFFPLNADLNQPPTVSTQSINGNTISPNVSQLNTFDSYGNQNLNNYLSTPQNSHVNSINNLNSQGNNILNNNSGNASIGILRSPNSFQTQLVSTNDNFLSSNILDLNGTNSSFNQSNNILSSTGNQGESSWSLVNASNSHGPPNGTMPQSYNYFDQPGANTLVPNFTQEANSGRPRSGSNRTIWSNNNGMTSNGHSIQNLLGTPLNLTATTDSPVQSSNHQQNYLYPQISPENHQTPSFHGLTDTNSINEEIINTSSPFSFKQKIFKFGSPVKSLNNSISTAKNEHEDHEKHTRSSSSLSQSSGFLSSGLTTTSRFFKKHRLSNVSNNGFPAVLEGLDFNGVNSEPNDLEGLLKGRDQDNANNSENYETTTHVGPSTPGGLRRLSFAFGKKEKKNEYEG